MNYSKTTDAVHSKSEEFVQSIMNEIRPHCRDEYVVAAVLRRELFMLASTTINIVKIGLLQELAERENSDAA